MKWLHLMITAIWLHATSTVPILTTKSLITLEGRNVARGRSAWYGSDAAGFSTEASRITDGLTSPDCGNSHMMPYIKIDLCASYEIDKVRIQYNEDSLNSKSIIEIRIGNSEEVKDNALCTLYGAAENGEVKTCQSVVTGRFLFAKQVSDQVLDVSICEIDAYTYSRPRACDEEVQRTNLVGKTNQHNIRGDGSTSATQQLEQSLNTENLETLTERATEVVTGVDWLDDEEKQEGVSSETVDTLLTQTEERSIEEIISELAEESDVKLDNRRQSKDVGEERTEEKEKRDSVKNTTAAQFCHEPQFFFILANNRSSNKIMEKVSQEIGDYYESSRAGMIASGVDEATANKRSLNLVTLLEKAAIKSLRAAVEEERVAQLVANGMDQDNAWAVASKESKATVDELAEEVALKTNEQVMAKQAETVERLLETRPNGTYINAPNSIVAVETAAERISAQVIENVESAKASMIASGVEEPIANQKSLAMAFRLDKTAIERVRNKLEEKKVADLVSTGVNLGTAKEMAREKIEDSARKLAEIVVEKTAARVITEQAESVEKVLKTHPNGTYVHASGSRAATDMAAEQVSERVVEAVELAKASMIATGINETTAYQKSLKMAPNLERAATKRIKEKVEEEKAAKLVATGVDQATAEAIANEEGEATARKLAAKIVQKSTEKIVATQAEAVEKLLKTSPNVTKVTNSGGITEKAAEQVSKQIVKTVQTARESIMASGVDETTANHRSLTMAARLEKAATDRLMKKIEEEKVAKLIATGVNRTTAKALARGESETQAREFAERIVIKTSEQIIAKQAETAERVFRTSPNGTYIHATNGSVAAEKAAELVSEQVVKAVESAEASMVASGVDGITANQKALRIAANLEKIATDRLKNKTEEVKVAKLVATGVDRTAAKAIARKEGEAIAEKVATKVVQKTTEKIIAQQANAVEKVLNDNQNGTYMYAPNNSVASEKVAERVSEQVVEAVESAKVAMIKNGVDEITANHKSLAIAARLEKTAVESFTKKIDEEKVAKLVATGVDQATAKEVVSKESKAAANRLKAKVVQKTTDKIIAKQAEAIEKLLKNNGTKLTNSTGIAEDAAELVSKQIVKTVQVAKASMMAKGVDERTANQKSMSMAVKLEKNATARLNKKFEEEKVAKLVATGVDRATATAVAKEESETQEKKLAEKIIEKTTEKIVAKQAEAAEKVLKTSLNDTFVHASGSIAAISKATDIISEQVVGAVESAKAGMLASGVEEARANQKSLLMAASLERVATGRLRSKMENDKVAQLVATGVDRTTAKEVAREESEATARKLMEKVVAKTTEKIIAKQADAVEKVLKTSPNDTKETIVSEATEVVAEQVSAEVAEAVESAKASMVASGVDEKTANQKSLAMATRLEKAATDRLKKKIEEEKLTELVTSGVDQSTAKALAREESKATADQLAEEIAVKTTEKILANKAETVENVLEVAPNRTYTSNVTYPKIGEFNCSCKFDPSFFFFFTNNESSDDAVDKISQRVVDAVASEKAKMIASGLDKATVKKHSSKMIATLEAAATEGLRIRIAEDKETELIAEGKDKETARIVASEESKALAEQLASRVVQKTTEKIFERQLVNV